MNNELVADREQIAAFVDAMFRHADVGTFVSLRTFLELEEAPPYDIRGVPINGDATGLIDIAAGRALRAANYEKPCVFAPPVATFTGPKKARERDLACGLALSVELDKDPERSRKRLEFLLGPATITNASGGEWIDPDTGEVQDKLHVHWRLAEPTRDPEAHARLKQARVIATQLVGGDCTNKPIVHPIRWPGSWHRKAEPKLCRIVTLDPDAEIDLELALQALLEVAQQPRPNGGGPADPGRDRETDELIRRVITAEEYHAALRDLAWRYLKGGMAPAQVVLTLRGLMDASTGPRDDRWQHRRDQIPMLVSTAQEKTSGGASVPPDSDFPHSAQPNGQAAPAAEPAWPDPLGEVAYYGLAGEVVRTIEPHTESAPEALLVSFLLCFGNSLGRGPHVKVEGSKHATNEFAIFVGESSKARKGTGWKRGLQVFEAAEAAATVEGIDLNADGSWLADRVTHGLSSGEGLIHQVRDKQFKREPIKDKKGEVTGYREVESDEGVADKRLMVVEEEFAATLRIMTRDGNSLSSIIRQAWDNGNLKTLTKVFSSVTTGALISLVGHCTVDELRRYLDRTELSNGFANRFAFVCVKRSKCLPFGGEELDLSSLGVKVLEAQRRAAAIGQVLWTDQARYIWRKVYPDLSEGEPGLLGAMTSRGEAHVLRLAMLYALTDHSAFIEPYHLEAALELWRYCWQSTRFVFGDSLGDPLADEILRALREAPNGMTRTEISSLFGRHRDGAQITRALAALAARGLATKATEAGPGRSVERWRSS